MYSDSTIWITTTPWHVFSTQENIDSFTIRVGGNNVLPNLEKSADDWVWWVCACNFTAAIPPLHDSYTDNVATPCFVNSAVQDFATIGTVTSLCINENIVTSC